jgi:xanthine/uracil/vitamin C permease (AzgA family)
MFESIADYFRFRERSTSFAQEFRAGTSMFLTMSYILLVNPQVLSDAGISSNDVGECPSLRYTNDLYKLVIDTCLSSGFGTLISGIFGY